MKRTSIYVLFAIVALCTLNGCNTSKEEMETDIKVAESTEQQDESGNDTDLENSKTDMEEIEISNDPYIKTLSVSETPIDDFIYAENEEGIVIRGYTGNESEVVIPETIDGTVVTEIGDSAFRENDNLRGISFPKGLKSIGKEAFYKCSNLTTVIFPQEKMGNLILGEQCFYWSGITGALIINATSVRFDWQCLTGIYGIDEFAVLSKNVIICEDMLSYCKGVKKVFFEKDAEVIFEQRFINTDYGDCFGNMDSLEIFMAPDNIDFINNFSFSGTPLVTIFVDNESNTYGNVQKKGFPINTEDFQTEYKDFYQKMLEMGYEIE